MKLEGKKIFVTGGSRGIGSSIALMAAELGARVAITYASNEAKARETLEKLPGSGHLCVPMNLSDRASIDSALEKVLVEFAGLSGVVNNAGLKADNLILRMKAEDFEKVLEANLTGSFWVTKLAVKAMLKNQSGSIVNISSVVAHLANPGQANYSASKAGLEAMTRSVAMEVASRNLRINCVAPGFIQTDMTDSLPESVRMELQKRIPLQRIAEPQEVAAAVCFLLSDLSSYITGHTLHVNGGMWMQ